MFMTNSRIRNIVQRPSSRAILPSIRQWVFLTYWCAVAGLATSCVIAADVPSNTWRLPTLPAARNVVLEGYVGDMLHRGLTRLTIPPFNASYIRSDISYEDIHCYYDYSGTNVGETLEVWTQDRPVNGLQAKAFAELQATIAPYQKPDGHFGADIDPMKPVSTSNLLTPVLWGNSRMLLGLLMGWHISTMKTCSVWQRKSVISTSIPTMRYAHPVVSKNTSILSTEMKASKRATFQQSKGWLCFM